MIVKAEDDKGISVIVHADQLLNRVIVSEVNSARVHVSSFSFARQVVVDGAPDTLFVNIGTQGPAGPKGDKGDKGQKGDPGNFSLDDFNKYKNLSSQISQSTLMKIFDVGEPYINLRVYYNGRCQNQSIIGNVGTTFELDFIPADGKELFVFFDSP